MQIDSIRKQQTIDQGGRYKYRLGTLGPILLGEEESIAINQRTRSRCNAKFPSISVAAGYAITRYVTQKLKDKTMKILFDPFGILEFRPHMAQGSSWLPYKNSFS